MALVYDYSGVYNSLSQEASQALQALGIPSADLKALSELSFEKVLTALTSAAGESFSAPMKGFLTVLAVLLLCAMLSAYHSSLTGDVAQTAQTAAALCLSCAVAAPATAFIASANGVIAQSANLFHAYIPVAAVMMAASGKAVSALSYQAATVAACQGVARVSSSVILPLMNMFLGVAITAGIAPEARLQGFLSLITRAAKWVLGFMTAVFTAVLSLRRTASSALDTVSGRAARFALSSCIPMVGGALSEAYKSVQGGLQALKSGLGVFVILALALTFLPLLLRGIGWAVCLFLGKAVAEALGIGGCAQVLDALGTVFSTLIAVICCMLTVFIIAAATALTVGSGT